MDDVFKRLEVFAKRKDEWLEGEFSFLSQLNDAIERKDLRRTESLFVRLARYERKLERFHERFQAALGAEPSDGTPIYQIDEAKGLEQQIKVFQNTLKRDLSRFTGSWRKLLTREKWDELRVLYTEIDQAIRAWVALDERLLAFERKAHDEGWSIADTIENMLSEIERDPSIVKDSSFIERLANLCADRTKRKALIERLSAISRTTSVLSKSAALVFVAWVLAKYVVPWLTPTYHHQHMQQVNVLLNQKDVIQDWVDSLPAEHKYIVINKVLQKNRGIIEAQLDVLLHQYSGQIYDHIIGQLHRNYAVIAHEARQQAAQHPGIDASLINPAKSYTEIESDFLGVLGITRDNVKDDIYKHLRQYYIVDVVNPVLPGVKDLALDIIRMDPSSIWEDLKWGAAEPTPKIRLEDTIRLRLNTVLEPTVNELKEHLADTLTLRRVWRQVAKTITTVITEPSKAKVQLEALYAEIGNVGAGWAVILVVLALSGALPLVATILPVLLRIFVFNYIRDIKFIMTYYIRKNRGAA